MKTKLMVLAAVGFLVAGVASADVYKIDAAHTTVGFTIRHMVINNVVGSFKQFEGTFEYDGADVATMKLSGKIQAASIDTGIAARDEHLRGPDFFDVAKYPEITFQSARVEKQGDQYMMYGSFTMHGVTKEIVMPLTITGPITDPWGKVRVGLETSLTINRKDYGINWSQTLDNGGLVVADEVKIQIGAEAVKE